MQAYKATLPASAARSKEHWDFCRRDLLDHVVILNERPTPTKTANPGLFCLQT